MSNLINASTNLTLEAIESARNSLNESPSETTAEEINGASVDETKNPEFDTDEMAAIFINQAHKQFKKLGYEIANRKKRSVVRVLEAVLFEPLEQVELLGKEEKQLFDLCQKVMYHKGILLKYAHEKFNKTKQGEELNEHSEKI